MPRSESRASSGYWYGADPAGGLAVEVLNAMREYRVAEAAMRKRTRDAMRLGETDMLALRLLLQAQSAGRTLGPKDLSAALSISSASTTILVDRLERSGHVVRRPHPSDRRAIVVVPTGDTDLEVRATLAAMHKRMVAVAEALPRERAQVVLEFLTAMTDAITVVDEPSVRSATASEY